MGYASANANSSSHLYSGNINNTAMQPKKVHLKIEDDFSESKLKSLGESLLAKTPYAHSSTSAASKKTVISYTSAGKKESKTRTFSPVFIKHK